MTSATRVHEILGRHNVVLTLLDLGASADSYEPFRAAAPSAMTIEVDPDNRDFGTRQDGKTVVVREAIADNEVVESLTLYLTRSPHCSSTLKPDFRKLRNFPYDDLFEIVGTAQVPATSLNRLSAKMGRSFDWIKLDTQGTEYRIVQSMSEKLLADLICCDVEISLYAHYEGADTFPRFHDLMVANGFFVSDILAMQQRVRIRRSDAERLSARGISQRLMKTCPTSPELRYIRAINHDEHVDNLDRFLRIWAVAFFTRNYPYCYSLATHLLDSSTHADLARELEALAYEQLRRARPGQASARAVKRLSEWLQRRLNT